MKEPSLSSLALQPARVYTTSNLNMADYFDSSGKKSNSIVVSGRAVRVLEPDVCDMQIVLECKPKMTAQEAKDSVIRREDYVKQVLANFFCRESDIEITHMLQPTSVTSKDKPETQYIFKSEFWVKMRRSSSSVGGEGGGSLVGRASDVHNVLMEKVGPDFVSVSSPLVFSHSNELMQKVRSEVSSAAVLDAKKKALHVVKNLSQENRPTVKLANHGLPSSISENDFSEKVDKVVDSANKSWSELHRRASCRIEAEFLCTFDLKLSTSKAKLNSAGLK